MSRVAPTPNSPADAALDRPLGLRFHFQSAAASCEGRALAPFMPDDTGLFNALADLFYEVAEQDEHDNPIGRKLLAIADILNDLGDDAAGGRGLDYREIRREQHPKAAAR